MAFSATATAASRAAEAVEREWIMLFCGRISLYISITWCYAILSAKPSYFSFSGMP